MWKNIDKVRAHREQLKTLWFAHDHSNKVEKFTINVIMDKYHDRAGSAIVKIEKDTKDSYTSFSTHQENPFLYLSEREEFNSGEYELIIQD